MDIGTVDELRELLLAGPVWGAEIDTRFRVLAVTIEPSAEVHPDGDTADRRLQVLFHPVGTIAASLVQAGDDEPTTVLQFTEDQLPDVVSTLDGPVPTGEPLPDALPDLDAMTDRLSMRGAARTGDGTAHHLHLSLAADDLQLDLWASYDVVEVHTPDEVAAHREG